ncbi:MAG: bile acid:sodium symporter, partial [Williamsia herbipolensis]|nr:bile acid:sodium symporter [Williamsia herbipolensis]
RWWQILVVIGGSVVLVAVMLFLTGWVARRFHFGRADAVAIRFCGTKKSLATGLPMAAVLFANQQIGLIVLPLLVFHQIQLMMCAWYAARLSRENPAISSADDSLGASPR